MTKSTHICTVFVYGTLQSGQCRQACWPHPPIEIRPAWTLGALYDRTDYPAMKSGSDRVRGQWWRFDPEHLASTLQALDEVEAAPDLYQRVIVDVFDIPSELRTSDETSAPVVRDSAVRDSAVRASVESADRVAADRVSLGQAWTYLYVADPVDHGFKKLSPNRNGFVQWPS